MCCSLARLKLKLIKGSWQQRANDLYFIICCVKLILYGPWEREIICSLSSYWFWSSVKHWLYLVKQIIKWILKHSCLFTHRYPSFAPSTRYSRIPSQSLVPLVLRVLRGLVDPKENLAETGEMQVFLLITKILLIQFWKDFLMFIWEIANSLFTGFLMHIIHNDGKCFVYF